MYNEKQIREMHLRNLEQAKAGLAQLEVFCGAKPVFGGLTGWVFEKTIQFCIRQEYSHQKIDCEIQEQCSLDGRAKADLRVGTTAIEIKSKGLFGSKESARYAVCREAAKRKGLHYLFLTLDESHKPYRDAISKALGQDQVFFLSEDGSWARLINTLILNMKRKAD